MQSIRSKSIILQQIIQYIPGHLANKLAKEYEMDKKAKDVQSHSNDALWSIISCAESE